MGPELPSAPGRLELSAGTVLFAELFNTDKKNMSISLRSGPKKRAVFVGRKLYPRSGISTHFACHRTKTKCIFSKFFEVGSPDSSCTHVRGKIMRTIAQSRLFHPLPDLLIG